MNNRVSASPAAATTTDQSPNCSDDCYLLKFVEQRSDTVVIVFCLPLSFLLVVFSCLTILVTRRSTRLTERPSAKLVINLGVTGALIGGVIIVYTTVQLTVDLTVRYKALFGMLLPRLLHIVTTLTLTCLTLDRYLALCKPLRYPTLLTETRCLMLVGVSWAIPVVFACFCLKAFTTCANVRPYLVTYLFILGSATAAIFVMYLLIAREFRRPVGSAVGGEELMKVRHRTAKELMVVVMLTLLLDTPDAGMKLYLLSCPKTLPELNDVVPLLLLVHLICFYPLYAWKNTDFRKGMLEVCAAFRKSFVRVLRKMCCGVSFNQMPFARISFTRASSSSVSTVTMSTVPPPTATTTNTILPSSSSVSLSNSSSVSAVPPAGENNVLRD